jgi:hypothetical protein
MTFFQPSQQQQLDSIQKEIEAKQAELDTVYSAATNEAICYFRELIHREKFTLVKMYNMETEKSMWICFKPTVEVPEDFSDEFEHYAHADFYQWLDSIPEEDYIRWDF